MAKKTAKIKKVSKKVIKKARKKAEKKLVLKCMKKGKLEALRKLLVAKRDDLLSLVKKKHFDMPDNEIGDEVDSATMSVEKEILFELTNNEKAMLDTIESALRKIEQNNFGACESCSKPITFNRLKAMPWVRYCITCQKAYETPAE
ncbi:MAG: TraR/DksA family transcriptional regulator [Elusimicrobia bacterium]|nr:TraR/DksA family transcriptional regulator [Elusimicrobiota bacterium]